MTAQLALKFPGTMHYARVETSPRLQRALAYLRDGQWHSTRDIIREANVCAVNSVMAELLAQGYTYDTEWRGGYHYYRLTLDAVDRARIFFNKKII